METLICSKCGKEKTLDNFKLNNKRKRGFDYWCKECCKIYDSKRYGEKKSQIISLKKERRDFNKKWFSSYKENLVCSKCGEDHPACLEFHHIDGNTKENDISTLVVQGYSLEKIEDEIKKCVVLCSNCHKKLHFEVRQKNGM